MKIKDLEISGTSFNEQVTFFYVKKYFSDALNRYKCPEIKFMELDIYIPSIKVGIEYDGYYWHNDVEIHNNQPKIDMSKYKMCKKQGITLIRMKELPCNEEINADKIFYIKYRNNKDYFGNDVKKVLEYVVDLAKNKGVLINKNITVDILDDKIDIMTQYMNHIKERSLATRFPEIAAEWHPTKNGELKPEYISAFTKETFYWKCKYCGATFEASPCDRVKKNTLGCIQCNIEKLKELNIKGKFFMQCDLEDNPIKLWRGIGTAADVLNVGHKVMRKTLYSEAKTFGGYKWYFLDEFINKYPEQKNKCMLSYREILQCDLYKSVIKKWSSINEAANELNLDAESIYKCACWETVSYAGYKWKFVYEDDENCNIDKNAYKNKSAIYKCDLMGNIIQKYDRVKDCAKELGVPSSNITACLIGNTLSVNGFTFKYVDNMRTIVEHKIKVTGHEIYQCDLDGNIIKEWESSAEASRELHCDPNIIRSCIKGIRTDYLNCIWKYKNEESAKFEKNTLKNIGQYDLNNKLVKIWESLSAIVKANPGFNRNKISDCLNNILPEYNGYIWKREVTLQKGKKRVYQCDLEGKILKEFPSITDAANELHMDSDKISLCARGRKKDYRGYTWKFVEQEDRKNDTNRKGVPIYQCDLNGNIIKKYESIIEAVTQTGYKQDHICACCKGRKENYNGYIWKYVEEPVPKVAKQTFITKPINQYTLDGKFIQRYESMTEASVKYNVSTESLRRCAVGQTKRCVGYVWKYDEK